MENYQKPKVSPFIVLEFFGLSVTMGLGFGVAFYAGYNSLPYLLIPTVFLELACSSCFALNSRYLRGKMFQADQLNNIKGSFFFGCVLFSVSIVGSFVFGLMSLGYIQELFDDKYGDYLALGSSFLAVIWSCALIYDAMRYRNMWQRVVGNNIARPPIYLLP